LSNCAGGSGGGRENSRELRSSLPVGELIAFDIAAVESDQDSDECGRGVGGRREAAFQKSDRGPKLHDAKTDIDSDTDLDVLNESIDLFRILQIIYMCFRDI